MNIYKRWVFDKGYVVKSVTTRQRKNAPKSNELDADESQIA